MNTDNILITCIASEGHADEIMSVARQAGARGGTVLGARGTGTEEDVKFFGISMVPQKEMLLIVAQADLVQTIVAAICSMSIFSDPGSGIVYTTTVHQFHILGQCE